jgi:serine kinase of HPr protein (carbohydrate metabolism regulator)
LTDLFGIHSLRNQSTIDLIIRFEENFSPNCEKTKLGERSNCEILGISLPLVLLPFCAGTDACQLIEVVATLEILRIKGDDPSEELTKRLVKYMAEKE